MKKLIFFIIFVVLLTMATEATALRKAYFRVNADKITGNHKAMLDFDDDPETPPLAVKCIVYPTELAGDRRLIKVRFHKTLMNQLNATCAAQGIEHPFSLPGLVALKIANSFIGFERQDVLDALPSTRGFVLDINGDPTTVLKLPMKRFLIED